MDIRNKIKTLGKDGKLESTSKSVADELKRALVFLFTTNIHGKRMAYSEDIIRQIIHSIMGGMAAPGRATRQEASIGSIPISPTNTSANNPQVEKYY